MKKKKLRKITNALLLTSFVLLVISAVVHEIIPKHAFIVMHVLPGMIFTACGLIHMYLNNYPFRRRIPRG